MLYVAPLPPAPRRRVCDVPRHLSAPKGTIKFQAQLRGGQAPKGRAIL